MYVDYKATIWFRIPVDNKEVLDKCIDMLMAGHLPSALYDELDNDLGSCDVMYETEEFLHPEDNGDQPTIEVYEDDKKIWDNYLNTSGI